MRRTLMTACVAIMLVAPVGAGADGSHTRLYMLAGEGLGHNIWSTTASDPEASMPSKTFRCEVSQQHVSTWPCMSLATISKTIYHAIGFSAGSLLDAPVSWAAGEATFHIELAIESPVTPEVAVFVSNDEASLSPATQVAPGVWEGALAKAGSLDSRTNSNILIGVRSASGFLTMTFSGAGKSWFEFPEPFSGRSGPDVRAQNPAPADPQTFTSSERTFRFNDGDYEVRPFGGAHATTTTIPITLDRHAAAIQVYVEGFSEPLVYAAAYGDGFGEGTTEQPIVSIKTNTGTLRSRGPRAAALDDVAAGSYRAEVDPPGFWRNITGPPPRNISYSGFVVIVYGERTLAAVSFPFPPTSIAAFHTPVARNFPPLSEHVPIPEAATSIAPVVSITRPTGALDTWAMPWHGHDASGGAWNGQRIFTHDADVYIFGTTPMEEQHVSAQDGQFRLDVSYTYAPAA